MEDKNTNPLPEAAGDMPQFDLSTFDMDSPVPEEMPMDPLFTAEAPEEPFPDGDALLTELLAEETAAEAGSVPDALPAEDYLPEETAGSGFSSFDVPVEDSSGGSHGGVYPPDEPDYAPAGDPEVFIPIVWDDETGSGEVTAPAEGGDLPFTDGEGFAPTFEEQPILSAIEGDDGFTDLADDAAEPAAETDETTFQPQRKGRPRRKKGEGLLGIPHLLASLIWLAIVVSIGFSLGRMLWVCAADVLAFGRKEKEVVVTISAEDTIEDIAAILHDKGLIRYPGVFKLYASIAVDEGEISPGTYTLNTILDYHALVGQMSSSSSSRAVVEDVLIPEGYNCRQIFELLEQNGICTVAELEEYAANGEFQDFWFLEGVERGDKYCLEGFLFPDTYDFYAGSTPREALGKMLLGFNARFTEEMYNQLPALNERISAMMRKNGCSEEFIAANQLDLYGLLTVASLIEEETAGADESPTIASVIFNRLTQDQVYERYLGIDAAIIYATGDAENIDTSIESPYNTYTNAGLTPTPISNPGLNSIEAALNFEDTAYYYYVLNPSTGSHQFSKTYEEHQKWVEEFRNASSEES